jgi:hypothetical protein
MDKDYRYLRAKVGRDEHERLQAEARLAGYLDSEYIRILVREGQRVVHKRGIRRGDGLHFVEPERRERLRTGAGTTTGAGE